MWFSENLQALRMQIRKGFNLGDENIAGRGSDSSSDLEVYESMPVRRSHLGYNREEP